MQDWIMLVESSKRGDLKAFEGLVERFKDMAIGYAYSLLRDFHHAEDVAQEAFIKAFHDLPALQTARAFPSWLRRLVFKYADRLTRRKRHPTLDVDEIPEPSDASKSPASALEEREEREAVLACIKALPEGERTVTTLFYINGYSMSEVGSFLEVPLTTVKSRLVSARKRLKKRMVAMIKDSLGEHAAGEGFTARIREVLTRVPRVDFELFRYDRKGGVPRCPESVPFPSCLRASLEFTGQGYEPEIITAHDKKWRLDNSYVMAMGLSGAAFKLNWIRGWHPEITTVFCPGADSWAPQRKALEAMGIPHEILVNNGRNRDLFIRKIRKSVQEDHRPCIARGVLGPPEECLITGFDRNGDVLIGWSFFQKQKEFKNTVEYEENGCFRKTGWYESTPGVVIMGGRKEAGEGKDVYRKGLEWGARMMETEASGEGVPSGLAAYTAWIETLADEGEFAGAKVKDLVSRYKLHHVNVGLLAECRWYGRLFLDRAVRAGLPEGLSRSSQCFQKIHDTMWSIWGAVGGIGTSPDKAKRFADPDVRRRVISLLEEARELDRQALADIKETLRALS